MYNQPAAPGDYEQERVMNAGLSARVLVVVTHSNGRLIGDEDVNWRCEVEPRLVAGGSQSPRIE